MRAIVILMAALVASGCSYKSNMIYVTGDANRVERLADDIPAGSAIDDLGRNAKDLKDLITVDPVKLLSGDVVVSRVEKKPGALKSLLNKFKCDDDSDDVITPLPDFQITPEQITEIEATQ